MVRTNGLDEVYRKDPPIVVSYPYEAITSGLGYIKYYLTTADDDTGTSYFLKETALYSRIIETLQTNHAVVTKNFDTSTFKFTRTVSGTAYLNLGVKTETSAVGYISVRLFKWDGSTATAISPLVTETPGVGLKHLTHCFKLECAETTISAGEQLRLAVVFDPEAGSTGAYIAIGHDPMNRDGTTVVPSASDAITSSNINIPFKKD